MNIENLFRVNNDFYGNPRVVIKYIHFLKESETGLSNESAYNLAHKRAKNLGGKIYRGKDFGGGFVFESYNDKELVNSINQIINDK